MTIEDFKKNKEAMKVYNTVVNTKQSVFLCGKAGSGKSTLLKIILNDSNKKNIVVAPTGIASKNVSGSTLHSMFRLPLGVIFQDTKEIKNIWYREDKIIMFKNLELLVIDEISMVSSFVLDCVDFLLRSARGNALPFGGVQVLYVGDAFQLAPIVRQQDKDAVLSRYRSEMFFDSFVYNRQNILQVELTKCYRQVDKRFMYFLDAIRDKTIRLSELRELNEDCAAQYINEDELRITLTSTNEKAEQINAQKLAEIDEQEFTFEADIVGKFDIKNCIADQFLHLKLGAHVMFIKNKPQLNFFNGTLGIVEVLTEDVIKVRTEEDVLVILEKESWDDIEYELNHITGDNDKKIVGTMTQYPIRLGWSFTIHKSQGLTFSEVILDTGYGAFAAGQIYVALSRCKTLEGLYLVNKLMYKEIITNKRVIEFYKNLKAGIEEA